MAPSNRTPEEFTPNNELVDPIVETEVEAASSADFQPGGSMSSEPASVTPYTSTEDSVVPPPAKDKPSNTKLARVWAATIIGLLVLALLITFIAQNQDQVTLRYFAYEGQVNLGLALFIAAVGGGLVVAIAGVARVIQLRASARKKRKAQNK